MVKDASCFRMTHDDNIHISFRFERPFAGSNEMISVWWFYARVSSHEYFVLCDPVYTQKSSKGLT